MSVAPLTDDSAEYHTILTWLSALYDQFDTGWLTLFSIDRTTAERHTDWSPIDNYEQIAEHALNRADTCCVWFGAATRQRRLTGRRGGTEDCRELPGMWVDIDIAGPGHRTPYKLPTTVDEARQLIARFPLAPTIIIHSGGGLQAWWLYNEPLPAADSRRLLDRWAATWAQISQDTGWHVDNVFDPARIMRLPGTYNRKIDGNPRPVTITETGGPRYDPTGLDDHLIDPPPQPERSPSASVPYIGPDRPGDAFNATRNGADILSAAGWELHHRDRNGDEHWTRPGKERREGSSATVYAEDGHTTVWSDALPGVETRRPYDPFGLYTVLYHQGDFTASSDELERQGYGTKARDDDDLSWIGDTPTDPVAAAKPPAVNVLDTIRAGGDWILDAPAGIPSVWGDDEEVLWAEGESLIIAAPPGVGKTTIAIQLVWGRLGLLDELLGYPITPSDDKVLYLAMDRPRQIQRAMGRLARPNQRDTLNAQLAVRPGPPPSDLAKHPEILAYIANATGARTVIIDSLKDAAIGLADDEVGSGLNRAIQTALAEGIEVGALHHQRKGQNGTKPKSLEDVYGSTWIASGAGSVVLLWGQPGDSVVELAHLKQPGAAVGPLKIEHDHPAGTTKVTHGFDVLDYLRARPHGVTSRQAAHDQHGRDPNANQITAMRNKLNRLVAKGLAVKEDGEIGGGGGSDGHRWKPIDKTMDWVG